MKKLNVLFISHRGELGGGELSFLSLINALSETGIIQPFIILGEKGLFFEKCIGKGFYTKIISMPQIKRIPILAFFKILFFCIFYNIEIIHCNTTRSVMFSIPASLFTRAKIIWHNRGTDTRGKAEYILSFFCKKLIAISETVYEQLIDLKISENKISIVYNGIETAGYLNYYPNIETASKEKSMLTNRLNVGLIGRFTAEKNHNFAVETANILVNKKLLKNIRFYFIGSDNFGKSVLAQIKKKINEYNLSEYFIFTGFVDNVVHLIYNKLDIIIIPSFREAFGRVVLESWLGLTPIIANNIEGLSELIDHNRNGILIKPNDKEDCIENIIRLSENTEFRYKIISNGIIKIKNFDISASARAMMSIYLEIR